MARLKTPHMMEVLRWYEIVTPDGTKIRGVYIGTSPYGIELVVETGCVCRAVNLAIAQVAGVEELEDNDAARVSVPADGLVKGRWYTVEFLGGNIPGQFRKLAFCRNELCAVFREVPVSDGNERWLALGEFEAHEI